MTCKRAREAWNAGAGPLEQSQRQTSNRSRRPLRAHDSRAPGLRNRAQRGRSKVPAVQPSAHLGVYDPVVVRVHLSDDLALHVCDGVLQHGFTVARGVPVHTLGEPGTAAGRTGWKKPPQKQPQRSPHAPFSHLEAVLALGEFLVEVLHQPMVVVLTQTIEHKGIADLRRRP